MAIPITLFVLMFITATISVILQEINRKKYKYTNAKIAGMAVTFSVLSIMFLAFQIIHLIIV